MRLYTPTPVKLKLIVCLANVPNFTAWNPTKHLGEKVGPKIENIVKFYCETEPKVYSSN